MPESAVWLAAAQQIGSRLCAEAIFDGTGQRCNWLGRQDIQDSLLASYSVRAAALGPELYGGSAGVALFLAELCGAMGDIAAAETARAAIRRSVHYMKHRPTGASPLSFFAGHLGMAYAACRLMELDPAADLENEVDWLVEQIVPGMAEPQPLDVIGGCAGAIAPLLKLAGRPGLERFVDVAVACGEAICGSAQWQDGMCRWEPARVSGQGPPSPPLTGMSHGAAGLGLGLLALHAHTGRTAYRDVARGAFAFEDSLYSAADENWIDTRFPYSWEQGMLKGTFQRAWCHGAPGIALAHMHAARLDPAGAGDHRHKAAAGVKTALAAIAEHLQEPGHDATLCHGIAGLSETVLTYGALFDEACQATAAETAGALIRRYAAAGDWPSGVNAGGANPSLMIGTSGIGYHLLRCAAPQAMPSVLSLLL